MEEGRLGRAVWPEAGGQRNASGGPRRRGSGDPDGTRAEGGKCRGRALASAARTQGPPAREGTAPRLSDSVVHNEGHQRAVRHDFLSQVSSCLVSSQRPLRKAALQVGKATERVRVVRLPAGTRPVGGKATSSPTSPAVQLGGPMHARDSAQGQALSRCSANAAVII